MTELKSGEYTLNTIQTVLPFRFLEKKRAADLLELSNVIRFEEGETIITQGDMNQSFYSILKGSVKVTVHRGSDGGESYICTIGKGEIFGEAGMFLKVPRTANIICADESDVVMITRPNLLKFIKIFPSDGNRVLMMIIFSLLRKLKEVNQELAYERKEDIGQDDIDSLVQDMLG
ncbi:MULTISPECIES: cyclic nucleotide-binding domain-containing protein [unclassified Oceanispirochaeta]|uniref:cyclic nucleotide-binding domain-containing protein n=1 Tax=unclassified Oceanispirochaeta TaxID=2635722 RepID=UPI000E08D673|nr:MULTISPECIES: cyclic nucleotide-binding domain-containing protein [unclassified Oceanispirochaeta]MBF9014930.1 cyclic nucleotide-binding domain-containing protein [Oceanispirochaeta sp. M2]NPD71389.1 cyclic nucleotide-binding domain-containing protein [Oceanispirochaeta sp. M1]RDG33354.1 cyclic nucleotide-binding domain-containing protein [Oceanispirochaeta sp. M1]